MKKDNRIVILDTKWKSIINNAGKNYGISQSDMYQMCAYSKKYGTPEIWLLYPMNKEMRASVPIRFSSKEKKDGKIETDINIHFITLGDPDCLNGLFNRIENKKQAY